MKLNYSVAVTVVLGLAITLLVLLLTTFNFKRIRDGKVIVNKATYDSLVVIANRPPDTVVVVHIDTIPGPTQIIYKPKYVYKDSIQTVYKDTIKNKHFKLNLIDTLRFNEIASRSYNYEVYTKDTTIYIEKEKPVFVPVEVLVSQRGFYYGTSIGANKIGSRLAVDLFYISKNSVYYGVSGGVFMHYNTKMDYYPDIGLRIGKRF